jgi:hypothetical protein
MGLACGGVVSRRCLRTAMGGVETRLSHRDGVAVAADLCGDGWKQRAYDKAGQRRGLQGLKDEARGPLLGLARV